MRTRNFVLASLAAAQEPNGRQKIEPGKLDFTVRPLLEQPNGNQNNEPGKLDFTYLQRPKPEKRRLLDLKFPAMRPLPGKLDFTLRPQRTPVPQERLFSPNRKLYLVSNPTP